MLRIYTGRSRLLTGALIEALKQDDAETQLVIVPKQLTLQTERMLLDALNLRGSFRLQVLSAERLCGRIFDAAGQPDGVKIDDRGRVMLVRTALRSCREQLTIYKGAERRRGFAERCADQLERIRQAGITPETLIACADEQNGAAALKLIDLSKILEAYQTLIEGRYQDGEAEFNAAIVRARDAAFLRESSVWFFGFDMVPPTLHELIAAVSAAAVDSGIFLSLENDEDARDYGVFWPMEHARMRLVQAAMKQGTTTKRIEVRDKMPEIRQDAGNALNLAELLGEVQREKKKNDILIVPPPARKHDLQLLEEELFAYPAKPSEGASSCIQMTFLRNLQEECRYAAALARRLVMRRGWHWDNILILCQDVESYAPTLRAAFEEYDVPLFLSSSRAAARHPLAECLLTAIQVIEKNYPAEDMIALWRTGFMPVSQDEADRLENYTVKYGMKGKRFLRPLTRGSEEEKETLEPIRARAMAPIVHLKDHLAAAATLQRQLEALYTFLTEIDGYNKSLIRMNALAEQGLREQAGEEGQVWNRILGAMDQMYALMGEDKLSRKELRESLSDSLSASVIKALPQSGDAVYAQSTDSACTRGAKAIFLIGLSDSPVNDNEGLLTPSQKKTLSEFTHAYLGPEEEDLSLLRRFYLKSALGMASEYVSLSCPMSGADGKAQAAGVLFSMVEALFPGMNVRGGVAGDEALEKMLRGAPGAAVSCAAKALAGEAEGSPMLPIDRAALASLARISGRMPKAQDGLKRLSAALNRNLAADTLNPAEAGRLYGAIPSISITRLERYAGCPFSYYIRYGLQPEKIEPFTLNFADEGSFFHSASHEFLMRSMDDLNTLTPDEAARRMDAVTELLLEQMVESGPLGDSAVSLAERRRLKATARICAQVFAEHMRGSQFHPSKLEHDFGKYDARTLTLPGGTVLEGRIDRVDTWENDDGGYLRVIDFKRGGKNLDLALAYYGLQLQLPIYLAAGLNLWGGRSAGVYYFPLEEGIVAVQDVNPTVIEQLRRKMFRLKGLVPDDIELLEAMSPDFRDVFDVKINKDNTFSKTTQTAAEADYRRLTRWTLDRAAEHLKNIQDGRCAPSPARMEKGSDPCQYCDAKGICMFDPKLDAACVRNFKKLPADEVLKRLALESENQEK